MHFFAKLLLSCSLLLVLMKASSQETLLKKMGGQSDPPQNYLPTKFTKTSAPIPDAAGAPTITDFNQATVKEIQYVTITGTNFDAKTTVNIGGKDVDIDEYNATHLKVVLKPNTSGSIIVKCTFVGGQCKHCHLS